MMMQKYIFWTFWLLVFAQNSQAQTRYAPNGGVFTPKGQLRALVVFVLFKDQAATNPNFINQNEYYEGWAVSENSRLPQTVDPKTGEMPAIMYSQFADFEQKKSDNIYNYSNDLNQISLGRFQLVGECFRDSNGLPVAVEIDADGCAGFVHTNKKAWAEMQRLNPRFSLAHLDQRKNNPNYLFDNSDTSQHKPEYILDYVIFIYRYRRAWGQQPAANMQYWAGADGGFAGTGLGLEDRYNGYGCSDGFTMCYNSGVFIHEVAHTLYNCPHLFGANKVVGEYLHRPALGWGATSQLNIFKGGLTAWERWYLGYIEPVLDLNEQSDQSKSYTVAIRDFVETGDAVRVELPFSGGQSVWVEYHSGNTIFDQHPWRGQLVGADTVQNTPAGVYIYVENISRSRYEIIGALSNKANGLKLLNAAGNYDYILTEKTAEKNPWGNDLYPWRRAEPNPISGTNPYYHPLVDLNGDGRLDFNKNYNQGGGEYVFLAKEWVQDSFINLYSCFGGYDAAKSEGYARVPSFQAGDILDMNSNPMLTNHPKYLLKEGKMQPYYLNGLSIKVENGSDAATKRITIAYRSRQLSKKQRWAGEIVLPNISRDSQADLIISKKARLELVDSRTPNRHLINTEGDFINYSRLTVDSGAVLLVKKGGHLHLKDSSSLRLPQGSSLILEKGAKLTIEASARLLLEGGLFTQQAGAKLLIKGRNRQQQIPTGSK